MKFTCGHIVRCDVCNVFTFCRSKSSVGSWQEQCNFHDIIPAHKQFLPSTTSLRKHTNTCVRHSIHMPARHNVHQLHDTRNALTPDMLSSQQRISPSAPADLSVSRVSVTLGGKLVRNSWRGGWSRVWWKSSTFREWEVRGSLTTFPLVKFQIPRKACSFVCSVVARECSWSLSPNLVMLHFGQCKCYCGSVGGTAVDDLIL